MLATYTFPSLVEDAHLPRRYYGELQSRPYFNDYIASPETTPFHAEGTILAHKRVADRARIDRQNNINYLASGNRQFIPKTTNRGFMPLNMSGNNTFTPTPMVGGFRTQVGQQYGMDLLQRRARQLEEMALAREEGVELDERARVGVDEPVPLDKIGEDQVAFELLLTELEATILGGNIGDITLGEVRKMFGLVRKIITKVDLPTLKEYFSRLSNLCNIVETDFSDIEPMSRREQSRRASLYVNLYRVFALTRVGIASFNMSDRSRRTYINQFVRRISALRLPTTINNIDELYTLLAKFDNRVKDEMDLADKINVREAPERRPVLDPRTERRPIREVEERVSRAREELRERSRRAAADIDEIPRRTVDFSLVLEPEEFGVEGVEGSGAWNKGFSRLQHLYGNGLEEESQDIRRPLNAHRFMEKRGVAEGNVIVAPRVNVRGTRLPRKPLEQATRTTRGR